MGTNKQVPNASDVLISDFKWLGINYDNEYPIMTFEFKATSSKEGLGFRMFDTQGNLIGISDNKLSVGENQIYSSDTVGEPSKVLFNPSYDQTFIFAWSIDYFFDLESENIVTYKKVLPKHDLRISVEPHPVIFEGNNQVYVTITNVGNVQYHIGNIEVNPSFDSFGISEYQYNRVNTGTHPLFSCPGESIIIELNRKNRIHEDGVWKDTEKGAFNLPIFDAGNKEEPIGEIKIICK